jgi:hypothetical protein
MPDKEISIPYSHILPQIMRTACLLLLVIYSYNGLLAQKPLAPSYFVCCPPIDKAELAKQFTPADANNPPYRLKFTPSASFKNKLQAYTNYLSSLYPQLKAFSQTWQIFDAGTGTWPSKTSLADIVPRNDGSAQNDCFTEFRPGSSDIVINPTSGLFPQRLQPDMWYTVKLIVATNEGQGKVSRIPKGCEVTSFSYKLRVNGGVVTATVSDENKIIKEYNVTADRCIDYNDRSQQALSNWKQNGNVSSITYQVEPTDHKFYLRFLDDDKESIVFNNADFHGNWLTLYGNKCLCFDYRIKYEASVDLTASYVPNLFIYTGSKNLENSGNSWNSGLLYAQFISNYNNVNNQWEHYCLPISLCKGRLPFNEYGRWQVNRADSCAAWDSIVKHVTGLIIPTDYNRAPTEEISFDNFCTTNCDTPSGEGGYTTCCPPLDKTELTAMLSSIAIRSPASSYNLQFAPTVAFNTRMSAFTSYLNSLYPGLKISYLWQFFDGGTASLPANIVSSSIAEIGDSTLAKRIFPSELQTGRWYIVKLRLNANERQGTASPISEECSSVTLYYRVNVVNGVRKVVLK